MSRNNTNLMLLNQNSPTPTPKSPCTTGYSYACNMLTENCGIADSGATSNFCPTNATVTDIQQATTPLLVRIPDGKQLQSSHTCKLDIAGLPEEARIGHIIPGMRGHSLISLTQLCRAGCHIQMTNDSLQVWYNGKEVMCGVKCPRTKLWLLPLNDTPDNITECQATDQLAANVYTYSSRAERIQYLHQACFSSTIETWCKAIENDQILSWPGLTATAVRKHLQPLPATAKGHMA